MGELIPFSSLADSKKTLDNPWILSWETDEIYWILKHQKDSAPYPRENQALQSIKSKIHPEKYSRGEWGNYSDFSSFLALVVLFAGAFFAGASTVGNSPTSLV